MNARGVLFSNACPNSVEKKMKGFQACRVKDSGVEVD